MTLLASIYELLDVGQLPGSDSARLDLEVLLAYVLKKDRSYLYTWPEKQLNDAEVLAFELLLQRRKQGEPIAHIIGQREFWSLPIRVNASTLIPRPDTELMVELVLEKLCHTNHLRLIDLGTGSGAIALALATEKKDWDIYGSDQSLNACRLAESNRAELAIGNVAIFCGHWLRALSAALFDVIVCNPPYICEGDRHLSEGDVRFEPLSALVSGCDGLSDIREIIVESIHHLNANGWLFIEHGYDQAAAVQNLFETAGFGAIETVNDYGGNPRVTLGCRP